MRTWTGDLVEEFDVVVVGSGGAALTAALYASNTGASVVVLEKSDYLGGTTAMSGGMIWIPDNQHMRELGIPDDRETALRYLRLVTQGKTDESALESFVDHGPEMLAFIEAESGVRYVSLPNFPDYHREWDGGCAGGRGLEPEPYAVEPLGALAESIRELAVPAITQAEIEEWRSTHVAIEPDSGRFARGNALVAPLVEACAEQGVTLVTGCAVERLHVDGGRVDGVQTADAGLILGTAAVILACGGYEWSPDMVARFLPGPIDGSCSARHNTGDGIRMAMAVGAGLGNMTEAWWQPQAKLPGEEENRGLEVERIWPGTIIVNRAGRRFSNEAGNYHDVVKAYHAHDPATGGFANLPAYLIVDFEHVSRYGFLDYKAGEPGPAWLKTGRTLKEMAAELDIDGDQLTKTVQRFNEYAREGRDPDFHRGETVYERYLGDQQAPHPALGPVERAPFFAVEVVSGVIGTKGGITTTPDGVVLNSFGEPIPGLYAAGNTTAHPMGPGYPGPGGTLGPGMTMAFLAARHCLSVGVPS
ncbi:MAG TPA: FAD-dependent oxidoreductase [Solirubrobacteraceae bacterium]